MLADLLIDRWTGVAVGWLMTYAVHSSLVIAGIWLLASRVRLTEAAKEVLWKSALIAGVVTASMQTAVTRAPLGGQVQLDAAAHREGARPVRLEVREEMVGSERRVRVVRSGDAPWTIIAATIWLAGAGAALLCLAFGHARVTRALGDRASLAGSPIDERLAAILSRTGVRRRVELTCSGAIASPLALAGGEVCLPRRALVELDPMEQESMLAHELAHVVRRDPQWLLGARVIEALFFFQPLNRIARRRMQESAEYLCDDWAVQRTRQPVMLARCLATVAEWIGTTPTVMPASAMVESGGSPLVRRVDRILGDDSSRRARSQRTAIVASTIAVLVLAGAAPRISVAGAPLADRTMTFVRAIATRDSTGHARGTEDALLVVRSVGRVPGASAGSRARVGTARIMVRPRSPDSVALDSVTVHALPRSPSFVGGSRASGQRRARVILLERTTSLERRAPR